MKLITEVVDELQYLKEEKEGKKQLYIEGIFAQAEIANRNKRIYPMSVLEGEINRYNKEAVQTNRATGELNHPAGPNINLDRVCLSIKSLIKENNNFRGKALITNTPCGKIVEGLIESGVRLGVSTRALGSLKPISEGLSEVQDDFRLIAIDCVADPSAPDAYVDALMENNEWVYNPATLTWVGKVVETQRKEVKSYSKRQLDENKIRLFEQFLNGFKS